MLMEMTDPNPDNLSGIDLLDGNNNAVMRLGIFRVGSGSTINTCHTWQHYNAVVGYYNNELQASLSGTPGPIVAAQVFAVLACLIGIGVIITLFLGFYFTRFLNYRTFRMVLPGLLITAGFFQFLTFLIFAISNCSCSTEQISQGLCKISTCSLLVAGRESLCAGLMYAGMGVGLIWYPKLTVPLLQGNRSRSAAPKSFMSTEEDDGMMEDAAVEVVSIDGPSSAQINVTTQDDMNGMPNLESPVASQIDIFEKDSRDTSETP